MHLYERKTAKINRPIAPRIAKVIPTALNPSFLFGPAAVGVLSLFQVVLIIAHFPENCIIPNSRITHIEVVFSLVGARVTLSNGSVPLDVGIIDKGNATGERLLGVSVSFEMVGTFIGPIVGREEGIKEGRLEGLAVGI